MYVVSDMVFSPGDIVQERYQIIEKLGQGGFGITYKAYDRQQSNLIVVVKQIKIVENNGDKEVTRDSDYLARLEREANALNHLEYSAIPRFYNSLFEGEYYYIVQEYIAGWNLSKEIRPGEPIEEGEALNILQEILPILQFVHDNNIIHRDIKPANIIRRESDHKLFLIDFGAVKEIVTEHTNASGIHLTIAIHSPGYTPPEQFHGQPILNSDIYALGIMMMQAVTGFSINTICHPERVPKVDNNGNYIWQDYAPEISTKLKEIISKMICFHSGDRYQNITEILQDLEQLEQQTPPPITPIEDRDQNVTEILQDLNQLASPVDTIVDLSPPPQLDDQPLTPLRNPPTLLQLKWYKIALPIIVLIAGLFSVIKISRAYNSVCSLKLDDNHSCGEEILDPLSRGSIRNRAAEQFQQRKSIKALNNYHKSWQKERRDAETLIYYNNALLDANNIDYHTISIAVPLSSDPDQAINSSSVAQDFLRGIAQAQTEVNLSLGVDHPDIDSQLSLFNFLTHRRVSPGKNKGLKVIIADDGNNDQQAQQMAQDISDTKNILGVVGHYTSQMTLKTIDIYQQKNLPQVSYGSTTKDLTEDPQTNFFRVVYTNKEEAATLLKYTQQSKLKDKKIAIFYNPSSPYSNRLKIELENQIKDLNQEDISIVKRFDLADEEGFSVNSALKQLDELGVTICFLIPDGQITNSLAKSIEVLKQDNGQRLMLGGNVLINSKVRQIETEQPLNLILSTFWHPTAAKESKFQQQSKRLWGTNVNGGTAMSYDATLALIEAIKRQPNPNRKGTIKQLTSKDFSVSNGATGEIFFNTPQNGDRLDFHPTLVKLHRCQNGSNRYVALSADDRQGLDMACQES